jgi:hypothetical protein
MGNKIKFHLDENISYSIALGLRHRGLDVTTTPEENLLGVSERMSEKSGFKLTVEQEDE